MDKYIKPQNSCAAIDLGTVTIAEIDEFMSSLVFLKQDDRVPDSILFHSYQPTLAVGARSLNPEDLLRPLSYFEKQGIELYQSVRGGGLTYHWSEQLLCYPVFKLAPQEQNIREYMYKLEEVGLRTLKHLGIDAERRREDTAQIGLWIGNNKIASMGIHVSRWVTSYGFALNLSGDTTPSEYIRPCGLSGVKLITAREILGNEPDRNEVIRSILKNISTIFNRTVFLTDSIKNRRKLESL